MIHQAIEEGLYAIMYCSPQLKLHWETMTTDQQYCNKYFIDLHYNFILLFGHREISNCTKLHIFAQIGPLNKIDEFFSLSKASYSQYIFLYEPKYDT